MAISLKPFDLLDPKIIFFSVYSLSHVCEWMIFLSVCVCVCVRVWVSATLTNVSELYTCFSHIYWYCFFFCIIPFLAIDLIQTKKTLNFNPPVFLSSSDLDFLETKTSNNRPQSAAVSSSTLGRNSLLFNFDPLFGRPSSVFKPPHNISEEPLLSPASSSVGSIQQLLNGNVVVTEEANEIAADPPLNDSLPLPDLFNNHHYSSDEGAVGFVDTARALTVRNLHGNIERFFYLFFFPIGTCNNECRTN